MQRLLILLTLLLLASGISIEAFAHSYDLNRQKHVSLEEIITDLQQVRVVYIGESHDRAAHHRAQLQLLQALHQAGAKLAIGLEMFREDGQVDLDRWVTGELTEELFRPIYAQHWSNWSLYRDIFIFARQEKIPMVGLNIPRKLVNQVALAGFASLSSEQKAELPLASCNVSPEYRAFIRRTLHGHPHDGKAFEHFCEAQILWDAGMAVNLEEYLLENPQRTVVVLAGSGHAWKHGIPEQLLRRGDYPSRVLLPETPGSLDESNSSADEADYLLLGVEHGPLH